MYEDLKKYSAKFITSLEFDGYVIEGFQLENFCYICRNFSRGYLRHPFFMQKNY